MDRVRVVRRRQLFNDLELDFHPLRTDTFDVDRDRVPDVQPFPDVRQTGEVGRQFNEAAVLLDAADNAPHRFPGAKRLAFSIQVPSNSRWVMVMRRRSRSMERTAAKIFWPSRNRSLG